MKQILIIKHNTMDDTQKQKLKEEGFIVVEHQHPEDVRVITKLEFDKELVLKCLVNAVQGNSDSTVARFANPFLKAISEELNQESP